MKRVLEVLIFASLAVGLHMVVLLRATGGAPLAAGGTAAPGITVAGASGDLNALIESWDSQPDPQMIEASEAPTQPDTPEQAAVQPVQMAEPLHETSVQQAAVVPSVSTPQVPRSLSRSPTAAMSVPVVATTAPDAALPIAVPTPSPPVQQMSRAAPTDLWTPQDTDMPDTPTPRAAEPEPVPEPSQAPTVAVMPRAKPAPPREVVRTSRTQTQPKAALPRAQARATRPQSQPSRPPAPARPAAGSTGGGGQSTRQAALAPGAGGKAQTDTYTASQITSAQKTYLSAVRRAVLRKKRYPRRAERRGVVGKATIRVTLDKAGNLISAVLVGSAGADVLDQAAMAAIKDVGRYPRIPQEMGKARVTLTLPIRFQKR